MEQEQEERARAMFSALRVEGAREDAILLAWRACVKTPAIVVCPFVRPSP